MAVTRTTTPTTTPAATRPKAAKAPSYQRYFVATEMPAICQLWLYRLLLKRPNLYHFLQQEELSDDTILGKFGLSEQILQVRKPGMVNFILQAKCRELAADPKVKIPGVLGFNIMELSQIIGFNEVEQQVLAVAVLLTTNEGLRAYARHIHLKQLSCLEHTLQIMLGCSAQQLNAAFKAKSALVSGGLLTLQLPADFEYVFDFITAGLAHELQQMTASPLALLRHLWQQVPAPTLDFSDYQHLQAPLQLLRTYLKNALLNRKAGVNILLYGPPGTGKTELARLLVEDLVYQGYQVSSEDVDEDILTGGERLRAYQIAQRCLTAGDRTLVIFDEAEDVFVQNPFSRGFVNRKGWMNQLLEQNPVPCVWLSNDISCIDNAVIRRFDMVIEIPTLPKALRANLLQQAASSLLSEADALDLTAHPELTPAVVQRAAKIVNEARNSNNSDDMPGEEPLSKQNHLADKQALSLLINSTLKAQGFNPQQAVPLARPAVYNPAFINADVDVSGLLAGLRNAGSARICLYGPPGSGKTAFCQYLAEQLEKPLLFKPASSLLSCYVGESEKLIAQAFTEASEDGAVLLLDEIDSFLQQRSKAEHSWQVTQVNELLQQMERFNGILLATTNQLPQLDQAALRRFDLIIGFTYLTDEQAMDLLHEHCKALNLPLQMAPLKQLKQLVQLTPLLTAGDFQAVARQARFRPLTSADAFVAELQKIVLLKGGGAIVMADTSNRLQ